MGSNPACPTKPCPITSPEDRACRVAALNDALLAGRSATETLEQWCAAPVLAERVAGPDPTPDPAVRDILGDAGCQFRYVRLRGGGVVLSVAENWYVPARLTSEMNVALETTDAPFGRVVGPLGCRRRTLQATILPPGGAFVIEHRAVLLAPGDVPVCVVRERYTREAVA